MQRPSATCWTRLAPSRIARDEHQATTRAKRDVGGRRAACLTATNSTVVPITSATSAMASTVVSEATPWAAATPAAISTSSAGASSGTPASPSRISTNSVR